MQFPGDLSTLAAAFQPVFGPYNPVHPPRGPWNNSTLRNLQLRENIVLTFFKIPAPMRRKIMQYDMHQGCTVRQSEVWPVDQIIL